MAGAYAIVHGCPLYILHSSRPLYIIGPLRRQPVGTLARLTCSCAITSPLLCDLGRSCRSPGQMRRTELIVGTSEPTRRVIALQEQELTYVIPDLRDLPLDRLAELGASALAYSIALYRQRLKETGIPLSSFNARI
jgi:hypothetical protein